MKQAMQKKHQGQEPKGAFREESKTGIRKTKRAENMKK